MLSAEFAEACNVVFSYCLRRGGVSKDASSRVSSDAAWSRCAHSSQSLFGTVTTIREALGVVTTYVQRPSSAHAEIYKRFGQPPRLVTCANHGNDGLGSRKSDSL